MENERYAPPLAHVGDVGLEAGGVQPIKFWPPSGRIGRLRFLAYGFVLYLIFFLGGFVLGLLGQRAGAALGLVGIVGLVAYTVASVTLLIQRSHDMDLSGWWCLVAFIPLVGLFWVLNPGTRGVNRWGAPPPPNSLIVKILGWALPALVVVGIVAAIALPALQMAGRGSTAVTPR